MHVLIIWTQKLFDENVFCWSINISLKCSPPPWRWGGSSTQARMLTYVSILRIPQMIWVWRVMVEWYIDGKTEELWEKPVPVPLCPPQIPHGLTRAWTRASVVRGRRPTTWAMIGPVWNVTWHLLIMWKLIWLKAQHIINIKEYTRIQ
jgi:hypothetical protein